MSLLIKALEQAAKDRSTARPEPQPAPVSQPAPANAAAAAPEPTLEPPPAPRAIASLGEPLPSRSTPSVQPPKPARAASTVPTPAVDRPAPQRRAAATTVSSVADTQQQQQRARAAAVVEAGSGAAQNAFAYLRGNPVMMLASIAVVFGVGFGIYVYLQIANPGMFVSKPATSSEPSPPPALPPVAPAAQGVSSPLAPAPSPQAAESAGYSATAPAPASGAIAPSMSAAEGIAPNAPAATPQSAAKAPAAEPIRNASPQPGLIAAASIVASDNRGETRATPERSADLRAEAASAPKPEVAPKPAAPARRPAQPREAADEPIAVKPTTVQPRVNPLVSQAYTLLQGGSLGEARALYGRVIEAEPLNIDALLGIAYIAAQENRSDDALKAYLRILQLNPRHAIAQAALIGLMGRADPIASETRLKQLLAREPSAFLHFVLGNLYADQSLWNQAQQAYFQAHHLEPDNPDYAYNLAVGLDHLGQSKLALEFYRRAERSATQQGRSNFNLSHARERIGSLSSQLE